MKIPAFGTRMGASIGLVAGVVLDVITSPGIPTLPGLLSYSLLGGVVGSVIGYHVDKYVGESRKDNHAQTELSDGTRSN